MGNRAVCETQTGAVAAGFPGAGNSHLPVPFSIQCGLDFVEKAPALPGPAQMMTKNLQIADLVG